MFSPTYDIWLLALLALFPVSRRIYVWFCAVDFAVFVTVYGYFHGLHPRTVVTIVLPFLVVARTVILVSVVRAATRPGRGAPALTPRLGRSRGNVLSRP